MIDRGIYPDDLVICDRSVTPTHDDVVVVDINSERSLKVYIAERGLAPRLEFGNRLYSRFTVPEHAEVAVVGVVMCSLHPLRLKLPRKRNGGA
jgi:DNA polymerase V